jgi:amino acid adenylation domain-containing protein
MAINQVLPTESDASEIRHLVEMVRQRARQHPERTAYVFLPDGEHEQGRLTFGELDRRAAALAAHLQARSLSGERALLVYDPGLEYIVAFYGCLYAGVIAVPVYPPDPLRFNRVLPRLMSILEQAEARVVLSSTEILEWSRQFFVKSPRTEHVLATDTLVSAGDESQWLPPDIGSESIAFLQYTSGSGGDPKGVILTHGNLLANLEQMGRMHHEGASAVLWLPPYHDMGLIGGILLLAYRGCPMVIMPPLAFVQRPIRWLEAISRYGATSSGSPNFGYELCVKKIDPAECTGLDLSTWRLACNGSEPIRSDTLERFFEKFAPYGLRRETFCPCYGLAEATLMVSCARLEQAPVLCTLDAAELEENRVRPAGEGDTPTRSLVSSGQPVDHDQVLIVDPNTLLPCPDDHVGEIWVSGPNIAQGYWNRPEESAATFAARLAGDDEASYLRTGDLGFLLDGELFVTGRIKDLIIVAGRNHYPQDIERTAEETHPALKHDGGAAFSVEIDGEERVVVVQEVLRPRKLDLEQLTQQVRAAVIEEHELPLAAVVFIQSGSMPKTSSGKVQRQACKQMFLADELLVLAQWRADATPPAAAESSPDDAPQTNTEEVLAGIWSEVLGVSQPGRHDDFFLHGGQSLLATQLMARVAIVWDVELPLAALFEAPTLAGLAERIDAAQRAAAKDGEQPAEHDAIVPIRREPGLPLSFAQQRLWFLDQLEPGNPFYNLPTAARLTGPLDVPALRRTLDELVRRHESLRSRFYASEGQPRLEILPAEPVELAEVDLQPLDESIRQQQLRERITQESRRPFDLAHGPLLRAVLFRLADDEHVLLVCMHHIVADGWSLGVLVGEMSAVYEAFCRGAASPLAPLTLQYVDFAAWQREHLPGPRLEQQLDYWRGQLADLPPALELPSDRPRSPQPTFAGALESRLLGSELSQRLDQASRAEGVTPFMFLLAGLDTLLHRYTGCDDLVVGSPIAGRTRRELEPLIGFFANMLVLRTDATGDPTFRELLGRVKQVTLGAYAHQDVPFEKLVNELEPTRCLHRSPLFQVALVLQNALPTTGGELPVRIEPLLVDNGTAKYDLTIYCWPRPQGLELVAEYSTERFEAATMTRLLAGLESLLAAAVARPELRLSELPVMAEANRQRLGEWGSGQRHPLPPDTLPQIFARQAAHAPDAIAVTDSRGSLTYQALDRRSNRLARFLRQLGVGPDVLVGLCVDRSCDMLVGLLGILKAGGAYVPLDPAYPPQRLAHMLADAQVRVLVTQTGLLDRLPEHEAEEVRLDADWPSVEREADDPLEPIALPEHLAYTIYTSGSTGQPKGVEITHRALANFLASFREEPGLESDDILLAVTTLSFDIAALELFLPLMVGAQTVIAEREVAVDGQALAALIEHSGATVMQATPATWRLLLAADWRPSRQIKIICGGEALPPALAAQLAQRATSLWNVYGPTETTIWSTVYEVRLPETNGVGNSVPLGRPIANTELYVLDRDRNLVPIGVPGELYIGGLGLARGYRHLPNLTRERFVPHPFNSDGGARLYRTGDLVRWLANGTLEFLGRADHQVKLRGHRIELGEIESILSRQPAVAEAAVLLRTDLPGDPRLVAYYVPTGQQDVEQHELAQWLKRQLPDYMLPACFVRLDQMPRTPNGKLDRQRLPKPDGLTAEPSGGFVPPASVTEQALAELWCELLQLARVGRHDHFFDLGGHSLLATQLVSRIRVQWEIELPLRAIFEAPELCNLAERVDAARAQGASTSRLPAIVPVDRDGRLPLSFAQQRLWFLDQMEPGNPVYVLPAAARLSGPLDRGLLEQSLAEVVRRHEGLRTIFPQHDGQPEQQILPAGQMHLEHVDLRHLATADRERELAEQMRTAARRPFDLARGPLVRAILFELAEREHVLLLVLHHIVADGWSLGVVLGDIAATYRTLAEGRTSSAAPAIQYVDFAVWQTQAFAGPALDEQLAWWQQQLAELPPPLDLPTDFPRPHAPRFTGGLVTRELSPELAEELHAASRAEGATFFMLLLAGFESLLARYSGQTRFCVGTPIANRTRVELESLVGFFANTLALPAELDGNPTFREHLARVKQTTLGAFAHQDVPLEKLVEALAPERSRNRAPLFQVALVLQNAPLALDQPGGLRVEPLAVDNGTAKYDLTLFCSEHHGRLVLSAEYSDELFTSATIGRMLESLERLLAAAARNPDLRLGELPLLSDAEEHRLLDEFNHTQSEFPQDQTLVGLWTDAARRFADRPAVDCGDESLSYRELQLRASRLAEELRSRGIGPGSRVALCVDRSPAMLIGMLGTLEAGAAYVPLDSGWPSARLTNLLTDAEVAALIADPATAAALPACDAPTIVVDWRQEPTVDALAGSTPLPADADSPAYVIYTSGSTGRPKGVEVSHRALVNHAWHLAGRLGLAAGQRVLQFISPSFDASAEEIFPALVSGATLVLCPATLACGGRPLAEFCQQQRIDVWHLPTAVWRQLVEELAAQNETLAEPPRVLLVGGEPAPYRTLASWRSLTHGHGRFLHAYGLTEAAVTSTLWETTLDELPKVVGQWLPIGRPIANTRAFVLDAFGQPAPLGVIGELFIGGVGLARGYYHNPELTAERFVYNPLARADVNGFGGRFYRTGDRVRWLADGNLEFLGRADQQLKFHGLRIEPAEIERALQSHPGVRDARVVARDGAAGQQLVAYVVPATDEGGSPLAAGVEGQQVDHWHSIFEGTYGNATGEAEPTFNLVGWNSSYTGRPIVEQEMRAWLDHTVNAIEDLRPDGLGRVLEIGCGTGMVLFRLAAHAREYWATDFSAASLAYVERSLAALPQRPAVTLLQQPADDFTGLDAFSFDVIILNSVVQYFPSADYLARVMTGIARLLKPGGAIYLGDIRSYPLLAAFHTSVELAHAADDVPRAELRERIARRIDQEQELCVAPAMFAAWAEESMPGARVEARLKRGGDTNELTRFRYDVVLHFGAHPLNAGPALCWSAEFGSLDRLRERLHRERPEQLTVNCVPNARVLADVHSWEMICDESGPATAGELRRELEPHSSAGLDPEAFWAMAEDCGYEAHIRWSEADEQGAFDVSFCRKGAATHLAPTELPTASHASRRRAAWSRYTTDPVKGLLAGHLVPELRARLADRLPAAWMPSSFVLLESLPLTAGGKLDRRALPAPTMCRPDWSGPVVGPRNEMETRLVDIWQHLLGVQPVGVHDNFFELGGHSMLAVKMVAEVEQTCGRQLPLGVLFQRPTVAQLAELLARPASTADSSSLVPIATAGQSAPLFLIHPAGGTVFCYRDLCRAIGEDRPLYGLQAEGLDGRHAPLTRIEDMAAHYVRAIRAVQPRGPYQLCGWSLGGDIAYEMACQLQQQGDEVGLLALLDAGARPPDRQTSDADFLAMLAGLFPDEQQVPLEALRQMTPDEQLGFFVERAKQAQLVAVDLDLESSARHVFEVFQANVQAIAEYRPRPYGGPIVLFKAAQQAVELPGDDVLGWRPYASGPIELHTVAGDHVHMLAGASVEQIARVLRNRLAVAR